MILYACSTNPGKLREFALAAELKPDLDIRIEPLPTLKDIPPPEENGASFEENARIKAIYYSQFTPEPVFADDSGLEVDALSGAPGVYSARYAGQDATDEANNTLLLRNLKPVARRSGRFVCVIALAHKAELLQTFHGAVEGEILHAPRGANGFGYDPLFYYPGFGCSFAELTPEQKWAVSHRGIAVRNLLNWFSKENLQAHFD